MDKIKLSSSNENLFLSGADFAGGRKNRDIILKKSGESRRVFISLDAAAPEAISLAIRLAGRGSRAEVFIMHRGWGVARSSMRVMLSHEAEDTYARATFRSALRDASRVDFDGMLYIAKGADGSDSYLSAKALMLSDKAIARIDPKLEILANSVKASHGATVGRLSDQDLFYFQSRGVDRNAAERILVETFLREAM
ncbi:MAG: SufD family Fe-S cluster assembly protein [bacterium]|nr:SufD family Fe-S cluster assembly protein [bacterium]